MKLILFLDISYLLINFVFFSNENIEIYLNGEDIKCYKTLNKY